MLLRYPGGKSRGKLAAQILAIIEKRLKETGCKSFCEPFFGGGGIAFMLLKRGLISHLAINDFDYSIARLWNTVIAHHGWLQAKVTAFEPSVDAFVYSKERILAGDGNAFDTLVAARLSHGGRGVMAGPQGGYKQTNREPPKRKDGTLGKIYDIKCRWNPVRLCKEIQEAHDLFSSVEIYRGRCQEKSYESFLDNKLLQGYLFYLDPPYYAQGESLYRCGFEGCHDDLAGRLAHQDNWVLSYDNHDYVRQLYCDCNLVEMSHAGNGGAKQANRELIITPF